MTSPAQPIAIDIFSGAGGMSLGFEQAGFDVRVAYDIEPINVATYARNFPDSEAVEADVHKLTGDAIRIKAKTRTVDVLFGGPPCQGFSVIGKRRADDPRNELLLEFARLVDEVRPRYFVVENVAGLTIGSARKSLQQFLARVTKAGYRCVEPVQILDASQFGVPQQRRRVFILGHLQSFAAPTYPTPRAGLPPTVWDAIGDVSLLDEHAGNDRGDLYEGPLGPPSAYASILRGEVDDPDDLAAEREVSDAGLAGCARSVHSATTIRRFAKTLPGHREHVSKFHRLAADGISYTIRAGTGPQNGSFMASRPIHPEYPRCITVREAARLHSFPDWFQFNETKWHGFRQIGNSVPPLMARAVAKCIMAALNRRKR
jgi:DNA (cytosine-5)-methyltransferase 1